ncbi:MAG: hypothetical protein R6X33_04355 [Candidatus Brocadiia bacterium]
MEAQERRQAIELLRGAAEALEADDRTEVIMPGWDEQFIDDRERGIRIAAEAIRARGKDPDEGTRVHARDLGYLVRYIADMLEE